MWFASTKSTIFTDRCVSTVKRGLLGNCSQKIDPTLPYYQPSFVLLPQPAISISDSSSESSVAQGTAIAFASQSARQQESVYLLVKKILVNWFLGLVIMALALFTLVYFGPKINYFFSGLTSSSLPAPLANFLGQLPAQELNLLNESSKLREDYQQHLTELTPQEQLEEAQDQQDQVETRYLPEIDPSLPEGDLIIISKIGVNTQLQRTETEEESLETGAWWVPDFGIPGDLQMPMIVTAHRYGWEWWWKSDYWQLHSFYKLPQLQAGDQVEIISEQRHFVYEVYAMEEGEQISDYDADLILYTCKHLNSPIRYFSYARLVR